MYKPSLDSAPDPELGRNFSFITADTVERWEHSDRFISSNSMLQHTLSPLFRPNYANNMAVAVYAGNEVRSTLKGSSANGIMMADELGGVWMGHTVPGLLDLTMNQPLFPDQELENGHLIMCLTLDLPTINLVAAKLKEVASTVFRMSVPLGLRKSLPGWQHSVPSIFRKSSPQPRPLHFMTKLKTLRATMLVRRPGERRCLYRTFAAAKRIVLDVYGHGKRTRPVCLKGYGVRNIDSISIKYPEQRVSYIDNKTDRSNFAVSTAAHWQTTGAAGPRQYWACTSTAEREDSTLMGGLIMCVQDYNVWWNFDNLKVKEPSCT